MKFHQRGFLYLMTGANGAGKTLFTLKEVQEKSVKEGRPVAYNGRFDIVEGGPLSAWKKIDAKEWQQEPDGTIFVFDECQHDFPNRGKGEVPGYVAAITEHRKHGFDFFLITQHPMNMDIFIRRLIGSPGYHRHLKRPMGADLVSQLEWPAVNANCEKPGAGESAAVKMIPFPKEVYSWYKSAELHTGKFRIPRMVWIMLACIIIVPILAYFAATAIMKPKAIAEKVLGAPVAGAVMVGKAPVASTTAKGVTVPEYLIARMPRIDGFVYTAPVYDALTTPVSVPYPAACIDGFNRRTQLRTCDCYTQQGTKLPVPQPMCKQIAENGFFIEWDQKVAPGGGFAAPSQASFEVAVAPGAKTEAQDGAVIGAMRAGSRRLP